MASSIKVQNNKTLIQLTGIGNCCIRVFYCKCQEANDSIYDSTTSLWRTTFTKIKDGAESLNKMAITQNNLRVVISTHSCMYLPILQIALDYE